MDQDIDGVSGATYTTRAIIESVREETWHVASKYLGFQIPVAEKLEIQFGIPEVTLIALYAVGFVGHQKKFKNKKQIRWVSMIAGMVILGFITTGP